MASFAQTTNAAFDIAQMTNLLEHDNRETRSALKELFKDPSRHVKQLPFLRSASLLCQFKAICADESISVRDSYP